MAKFCPCVYLALSRSSVENRFIVGGNKVAVAEFFIFKLGAVEKSSCNIGCGIAAVDYAVDPLVETCGVITASEAGRLHS